MTLPGQSDTPLSPLEAAKRHATLAGHYAQELLSEQAWRDDKVHAMQADQGHALRMVIAHGASAIASAILDLSEATREMVVP